MGPLIQCVISSAYHRRGESRLAHRTLEILRDRGLEAAISFAPWPRLDDCGVIHIFAGSDWPASLEQVVNARIQGIPVVITAFRWPVRTPDVAAYPTAALEAARIAASTCAQAALSLADVVITMSEAQERLLKTSSLLDPSLGKPDVAPLLFPVEPRHPAQQQSSEPFVLCPGVVAPENGQLDLLRAAGKLDAPLRFAGSTIYDPEYTAECSQHLRPGDSFLGPVGEDKLASLYSQAVASCLLAQDEHVRLEVLESCAAGIPTVSTPQESLREYAGDRVLSVNQGDPEDAARGLATALASARRAAQNLGSDSQTYAGKLLDIYAAAGARRPELNMRLVCDALSWRLQGLTGSLPESAPAMRAHFEEMLRVERARAADLYRRFRRVTSLPVIRQYLALRRWLASLRRT
jgi:glycosyltransferase involved in cell wall biosynthesis